MACVDFEMLRQHIDIPENAVRILSKAEKEILLNLTLIRNDGTLIEAPCFVVFHCSCRGPAKGGIRLRSGVTLEHTRVLAELMTWKTALSEIPFGGGKSSISLDPATLAPIERTAVFKEFVHMIRQDLDSGSYVPAPDMGTTPRDMAIIYGETHHLESVTGKPPSVGGLPGRKEATGHGVAHTASLAARLFLKRDLKGVTAAVQGFGNVGSWTCKFLQGNGAKVVAVSDVHGGVHDEKGLPIDRLMEAEASEGWLDGIGDKITNEELLELPVDILIPAATEDVITGKNAARIRTGLIIEGANGPIDKAADALLADKGVTIIPDILANSGGVIASYVEWRKAKSGSLTSTEETYSTIQDRIGVAFGKMVKVMKASKVSARTGAQVVAAEELVRSLTDRAWI